MTWDPTKVMQSWHLEWQKRPERLLNSRRSRVAWESAWICRSFDIILLQRRVGCLWLCMTVAPKIGDSQKFCRIWSCQWGWCTKTLQFLATPNGDIQRAVATSGLSGYPYVKQPGQTSIWEWASTMSEFFGTWPHHHYHHHTMRNDDAAKTDTDTDTEWCGYG